MNTHTYKHTYTHKYTHDYRHTTIHINTRTHTQPFVRDDLSLPIETDDGGNVQTASLTMTHHPPYTTTLH